MNRLVAILVLAACGGGGGKKKAAKASTVTTETSTTVAGTSTTAGGAGPATTAASNKTAATAAPANINGSPSNNYQPPAGSTPAKPATPGTYKYDTSGATSFGAQSSKPPPVTTLRVDPPTGTRQHSTHDMRKADGSGSVSETTLDYQPQGVFLVELKITTKTATTPQITDTEDFVANPPVNVAPTGVKPGQSVEFDISGSGTNVHVKIDFVPARPGDFGGKDVTAEKARRELGWSPTVSFEDGLRTTVEWFSHKWEKEERESRG